MLEGLDAVPWGKLTHAFGPAEDVPGCLRGIASADADRRKDAWCELYGNIWHQGTVYEATVHAVPFLIELVQSHDVADRHEIVDYLTTLSGGTSFAETNQASLQQFDKTSPELQAKAQRERAWGAATHARLCEGDEIYERLLNDDDAEVRASTAFLLGNLRGDVEQHAEWLRTRRRQEEDEGVRGYVLLALGLLPLGQAADVPLSAGILSDASAPANERLAAALCLANRMGHGAPDAARQTLSLATLDKLDGKFARVAIFKTNVGDLFWEALARAAPTDALIASMKTGPTQEEKCAFAAAALLTTFGSYEEQWAKGELTPLQASVIRAITQVPELWESENAWSIDYELWRHDLPEHLTELKQLLSDTSI